MSDQQLKQNNVEVLTAGPARIKSALQLIGEIRFNEDRQVHIVPRLTGIVESAGLEVLFDSATIELLELAPFTGYSLQAIGRQADADRSTGVSRHAAAPMRRSDAAHSASIIPPSV